MEEEIDFDIDDIISVELELEAESIDCKQMKEEIDSEIENPISVESALEAESYDSKEIIKLEVEEEM